MILKWGREGGGTFLFCWDNSPSVGLIFIPSVSILVSWEYDTVDNSASWWMGKCLEGYRGERGRRENRNRRREPPGDIQVWSLSKEGGKEGGLGKEISGDSTALGKPRLGQGGISGQRLFLGRIPYQIEIIWLQYPNHALSLAWRRRVIQGLSVNPSVDPKIVATRSLLKGNHVSPGPPTTSITHELWIYPLPSLFPNLVKSRKEMKNL